MGAMMRERFVLCAVVGAAVGLFGGCELVDGQDAGLPDAAVEASDVSGVWKISGEISRSGCLDTTYNSEAVTLDVAPFRVTQQTKAAEDGGVAQRASLMATGLPASTRFEAGSVVGLTIRFSLQEMAGRDEIRMDFEGQVDGLGDIRGRIFDGIGPREGCQFGGRFFLAIE